MYITVKLVNLVFFTRFFNSLSLIYIVRKFYSYFLQILFTNNDEFGYYTLKKKVSKCNDIK